MPVARILAALSLLLALALAPHAPARAEPARYTVVRVDTRSQHLELFLADDQGRPFHRFERLARQLAAQRRQLVFAMNAGMFHPDFQPVGLFVSEGREAHPIELSPGTGNFYLQPNGVFLVTATGPRVIESSEWMRIDRHDVRLATQSGPLLVHDGALTPPVRSPSTSLRTRNGVCADGPDAVFVISDDPVSLHDFARYFLEVLHCRDALYLDGAISSLYSPSRHRADNVADLGPIIAVVAERPREGP